MTAVDLEDLHCSCCGGDLASATGVCIECGYDELGYFDGIPGLEQRRLVEIPTDVAGVIRGHEAELEAALQED